MYPILFSIGNVHFYSYGFFAALAFVSGSIVIVNLALKKKIYYPELFDHLILLCVAAIIGARLSYFLIYNYQFTHWYEFFYIWNGGMISFGGMAGVLILAFFIFKKSIWQWLDIISLAFLSGLFFWRMGCFLTGDHPQIIYHGFLSINGEFPAILIESISGLVGFRIFNKLYKKTEKFYGLLFWLVMIYYGLVRIFVDGFRIDPMLIGLRSGQITGIVIVLLGIIGIIYTRRTKNVKKASQKVVSN